MTAVVLLIVTMPNSITLINCILVVVLRIELPLDIDLSPTELPLDIDLSLLSLPLPLDSLQSPLDLESLA